MGDICVDTKKILSYNSDRVFEGVEWIRLG